MTAKQTLEAILSKPSGPIRKFALMKAFGPALKTAGHKPETMDCDQMVREVTKILHRLK